MAYFAIDSWANIGLKYDCGSSPKNRKFDLPTAEEKAVADSRNVSLTKTQGPSVLLARW